jgi:hypothetical protein
MAVEVGQMIGLDGRRSRQKKGFSQKVFIGFIFVFLSSGLSFSAEKGFFAVQTHSLYGNPDVHQKTIERVKRTGASLIRDEMFWHLVELEKGQYAIPARGRENIENTVEAGIGIILLLNYSNSLYDGGMAPVSDEAVAAYARYCGYMAEQLRGQVEVFEIWNEPNTDGFWKPEKDPRAYAKVLKAAYSAIKEANPDAIVLGCSLAGMDVEFVEGVAQAGGLEAMDALSFHPYIPPDSPEARNLPGLIDQFSDRVNQLAGWEVPLWITEMGWPTHVGGGVTELRQAEMLARTYLPALAQDNLEALCWYWLGPDGPDEYWAEDRFSIYHPDDTPKPAARAYATMSNWLEGYRFQKPLETPQGARALMFNSAEGSLLALWAGDDGLYSTRLAASGVKSVIRMNGTVTDVTSEVDRVELFFDAEPLLVSLKKEASLESLDIEQEEAMEMVLAAGDVFFEYGPRKKEDIQVSSRWGETLVDIVLPDGAHAVALSAETAPGPARMDLETVTESEEGKRMLRIRPIRLEVSPPVRIAIQPFLGKGQQRNHVRINLEAVSEAARTFVVFDFSLVYPRQGAYQFNSTVDLSQPREIELPMPPDLHPGLTYDVRVEVTLPNEHQVEFEDVLSFYAAEYRSRIEVDGNLEEWALRPETSIILGVRNQFEHDRMSWDGPSDASALVDLAWNRKFIFLAARVWDDVFSDPHQGVEVYKNDGFELYFDTDPEGDYFEHSYSGDDHQWGVCASRAGAVVYRWSQRKGESEAGQAVIRRTTDGYILEAALPAAQLTPEGKREKFRGRLSSGTHFGFTIALNDDDTPNSVDPFLQDLQLQWSRRRNAFTNPAAFADLFFMK